MEASCPLCGMEGETIIHLFVSCPFAQQVWSRSPLLLDYGCNQFSSFIVFWDDLGTRWQMGVNRDECFALAVVIMWLIWKGRNGALFNGKVILPRVVVIRAMGCLSEFQCAPSYHYGYAICYRPIKTLGKRTTVVSKT